MGYSRDGTQRAGNELLAQVLEEQQRTNQLLEKLVELLQNDAMMRRIDSMVSS